MTDLEPVYAAIEVLAPRAVAVSAQAQVFGEAGAHVTFDLQRALRSLPRADFQGPVSIEYEHSIGDPWVNRQRTIDIVTEVLGSEH